MNISRDWMRLGPPWRCVFIHWSTRSVWYVKRVGVGYYGRRLVKVAA